MSLPNRLKALNQSKGRGNRRPESREGQGRIKAIKVIKPILEEFSRAKDAKSAKGWGEADIGGGDRRSERREGMGGAGD